MKTIVSGFVSFLIAALACGPAAAWSHANAYGGSTSHTYGSGSTTRTTAYGGSETHTYGQGTTATNRYGDTATHAYGSGSTTYTNTYGGSATHYYGSGATAYHPAYYPYHPPVPVYHAPYPVYHPPTTVNVYGSTCSGCGGWSTAGVAAAGAAVGMAAGVAIGSANANAANANAYSAGYAAGATNTAYAMGAIYPTVPAGATPAPISGITYYISGNTWFQPAYGANGIYYRVVPAPY